jgi:hypothetical protein
MMLGLNKEQKSLADPQKLPKGLETVWFLKMNCPPVRQPNGYNR